jgi:hypothetical protein
MKISQRDETIGDVRLQRGKPNGRFSKDLTNLKPWAWTNPVTVNVFYLSPAVIVASIGSSLA